MSEKKEYIERGALIAFVKSVRQRLTTDSNDFFTRDEMLRNFQQYIEHRPATDVEPVVRGEWVKKPLGIYYCSVCDEFVGSRGDEEYCEYDFCPHCGAVMTDEGMKNVMERSGSGE